MNDLELKNLLQTYENRLEEARVLNLQSWALNYKCFENMQTQKVKSKLNTLTRIKIAAVVLGIIWVLFLGLLLYGNRFSNIYFSSSVLAILVFSVAAIIVYIKHTVLIRQIDHSGSIMETQQKLTTLQASTIKIIRIMFLQTPFYTTFFWSQQWMMNDHLFWLIAFPVTLLFTALSIWLYKNISLENLNTKKGRWLMSGPEFSYIVKASSFLDEIKDFKKEASLES